MTDHTHDFVHQGDPSLDRLLFFSDGVFAIAITLLSIELRPPQGWDGSFHELFREGWTHLSAFLVSFAVIGVFWNTHRRIFVRVRRYSTAVFAANLALLASVALMPFATSLIYHSGRAGDALWIYVGLVAIAGVLQAGVWAAAAFVSKTMDPEIRLGRHVTALVGMGLFPGLLCFLSLMLIGTWGLLGAAICAAVMIVILRLFSRVQRRFEA